MEPIIVVLSEIYRHQTGITREELVENLMLDVNQFKVDGYLAGLIWAHTIKLIDDKYYPDLEQVTYDSIVKDQPINTSAGVIIINGEMQVLVVHPTFQKLWDIPKGAKDSVDMSLADTAARELCEETGISIDAKFLKYVGTIKITPYKEVVLFGFKGLAIDPLKCHCDSTFTGPDGKEYPEVDEFKFVSISVIEKYLPAPLANALKKSG